MSYRKLSKGKYRVEVEKRTKKSRRRKSKILTTTLKGKDLDFLIAQTEKELLEILNSDNAYKLSDYTFEEFANYFLEECDATQRTIDWYRKYLDLRTSDFFEGRKITEIEPQDIKKFISYLKNEISPRTGKKLSPKTIKHYRDLLRVIFNFAKNELKIIKENPVDNIKIPKQDSSIKGGFYEPQEIQESILMLEKYGYVKYLVFFVLQVYSGARPSEMYGLKWSKIDFNTGEILIDEGLVKTSIGYVQKPTKTEDSRLVKSSPYLMMKLEELKSLESLKHNTSDFEDKYVFTNDKGEHLNQSAFRIYYRNFCKRYDLKYIPPYGLRHTSATILSYENVPMVNISSHMGHTDRSTTNKYIHATTKAADVVTEILTDVTTPKLKAVK